MIKEQNAKNRIEKSSFFDEIPLEYRAEKLPHMERKESQICRIEGLKNELSKVNLTSRTIFSKISRYKKIYNIFDLNSCNVYWMKKKY